MLRLGVEPRPVLSESTVQSPLHYRSSVIPAGLEPALILFRKQVPIL